MKKDQLIKGPSKQKNDEADKKEKIEKLSKLSSLEKLPQVDEVASNLSLRDIVNVSQASKTTHRIFKKPRDAAQLLKLVHEADYDAAEAMAKEDPSLMFQSVLYQHADGTYETISPLQLAIKLCDTYMWKMFHEQIVKNNPQLLESFIKQAHAQKEKELVNLEPLFAEYRTFDEKYNLWAEGEISDKEMNEAWLNFGKKQREILPRHMLKEFCRKGHSWSDESKFDAYVDDRPIDANIYNFNTGNDEPILPFHRNSGLGYDFSLLRGPEAEVGHGMANFPGLGSIAFDLAMFDRLCKVRIEDLNRLPQLAPVSASTQKMKK